MNADSQDRFEIWKKVNKIQFYHDYELMESAWLTQEAYWSKLINDHLDRTAKKDAEIEVKIQTINEHLARLIDDLKHQTPEATQWYIKQQQAKISELEKCLAESLRMNRSMTEHVVHNTKSVDASQLHALESQVAFLLERNSALEKVAEAARNYFERRPGIEQYNVMLAYEARAALLKALDACSPKER